MILGDKRRCPACGEFKSFGDFYLRKGKPGGYCKPCTKAKALAWDRNRMDKLVGFEEAQRRRDRRKMFDGLLEHDSISEGKKTCRKCLEQKNVADFYYVRNKGYDSYCRPCRLSIDKELGTKDHGKTLGRLMCAARIRSRNQGMEFDLDKGFLLSLWEEQEGKCRYSGVEMTYSGDRAHTAVSIDRVYSSRGYTKDNVVLCCWRINEMKSNMSVEEFVETCISVLTTFIGVSNVQAFNLEALLQLCPGRTGGRSNWPLRQVTDESASGELLEPSARCGGGNQQPSCGKRYGTAEGSETRRVSIASNNPSHECPTSLTG